MTVGQVRSSKSTDCIGRIPFASLIALLMCWVGVGLFCVMMNQAINASVQQSRRFFTPNQPWFDRIQMVFILVAALMFIVSLMLFIVGLLATGTTRSNIYSGWKARVGGRISCGFFLGITYVLNLVWMGVFVFSVVLAFIYWIFSSLCFYEGPLLDENCLNFTVLTPLINSTNTRTSQLVVCGSGLQQFCALSDTAALWYYIGLAGCLLVILGLKHFMICLASNYAHIKDGAKYSEFQDIFNAEEIELVGTAMPVLKGTRISTQNLRT